MQFYNLFFLFCFICNFLNGWKLTVMTRPVGKNFPWEHKAVMRSLLQGLQKIDIPFNYNPHNITDIGDVVMVVSCEDAVKQAVNFKKNGRIKKLLVGPFFVPHQVNYKEIDLFFVPSEPVIRMCSDMLANFSIRCAVWYAGIDEKYWMPTIFNYQKSKDVLVYWKNEEEQFCKQVENLLRRYGWNPKRIKYGNYNIQQYKKVLSECSFAVFLSRSESQGMALAEAWAMDIPTFPWNPMLLHAFGHSFDYISSCPYLTSATGISWKNILDFESILKSLDKLLPTFSPRNWVLENMTDEISVRLLVEIIERELWLS